MLKVLQEALLLGLSYLLFCLLLLCCYCTNKEDVFIMLNCLKVELHLKLHALCGKYQYLQLSYSYSVRSTKL